MATRTGHLDVRASERKRRRVVVKLPAGPESRVMAKLTGCGEAHLDMVNWRGRGVVILEVAGHASGVGARQIVIIVDMAVRADAWRDHV